MVGFDSAILTLERLGVTDVLLPFILVFTIVFAVMSKMNILGENKKVHVTVALVMGLALVIPHVTNSYPNNSDPVNIINQSLPSVSVIAVAIVCVLILLGVLGLPFPTKDNDKSVLASIFWILSFGVVIYIFGSSAGWGWRIPNWLSFLNDSDTQALLVIILVFGLIISYITKPADAPKNKITDTWKNIIDGITK